MPFEIVGYAEFQVIADNSLPFKNKLYLMALRPQRIRASSITVDSLFMAVKTQYCYIYCNLFTVTCLERNIVENLQILNCVLNKREQTILC